MTQCPPVLAILPALLIASPAFAQCAYQANEVVTVCPLGVEAPPSVDPVPSIAVGPPTLPKPVRDMLEAAMRTDDSAALAAVVKFAIQTQPDHKDEIREMQRAYLDQSAAAIAARTQAEQQRIRQSGILDLWKGQVELGAFQSTGNTSNFGFTGAVKLDRMGIDWQHTIQLNADYQKDKGTVSREQYGASYQPRYTLGDRIFTYGRLQYESDRIQGFIDRDSLSGGLGYRVLRGKDLVLSLEIGPAVRRTNFVTQPSETTWSVLNSVDFDWKVNSNVRLTQNASSYIGSDNSSFTSLTGLEAGMMRGLKAKLSYSIEHETAPTAGALSTDTISRFSLVYGF